MSSTDTIEEEVRQIKQAEIAAFTMPKPCLGECVTWYPDANKQLPGEIAFVLRVGHRNIVLQVASGTVRETVYHIDDPKLQISADIRESGAWGFTESHKKALANEKRLEDALARLAALEELVGGGTPKKAERDRQKAL